MIQAAHVRRVVPRTESSRPAIMLEGELPVTLEGEEPHAGQNTVGTGLTDRSRRCGGLAATSGSGRRRPWRSAIVTRTAPLRAEWAWRVGSGLISFADGPERRATGYGRDRGEVDRYSRKAANGARA